MLLVSLLGWWYGAGWLTLMRRVGSSSQRVLQFFSVSELAGSLFAPFRQISAGHVNGPLGAQLQAFGDRLLSRFIGALVRSLLIIVGLIAALFVGLFGVATMVAWPFLPALPFIGVGLMLAGFAI